MSLIELPRWIKSSITVHFSGYLREHMSFHVEGERPEIKQGANWAELRIDGPFITPQASNYFNIMVEIDVLLATMADTKNLYKMEENQGYVFNAFTNTIGVNKYGTGGDFVECLQLDNRIITNNFGFIDPINKIMQASIEGHYFMNLQLN